MRFITIQTTNLGDFFFFFDLHLKQIHLVLDFFCKVQASNKGQIQGLVKVDARDVRIAALSSPAWKAFLQQNLTRGEDFDGEADGDE